MSDGPTVVERALTPRGELVLRRDDGHFELISNGTFLMDTRNGESERLLVRSAYARHRRPRRVLIAGLGIGFTLAEALDDPRVERVVVVEIEPDVVRWHSDYLAEWSQRGLDDPRTQVVLADITDHLRATGDDYDVICLDIDNGPDWTVTDANRSLYDEAGTALIVSRLRPRGVLSVWAAARAPDYETLLHRHFASVEVHEVAVQRGQPDVVVVGSASSARFS